MMKVRIWTSTLALAAALLGIPALVQACPDMGGGARDGAAMPHMEKMAQKIGLSAAQQAQMKALHDQHRAAMQENREQSKKLQAERSAAWAAPTLDAARLENLRVQEVKLFDAMSRQRLEHQLAVAIILSPEQRQAMQNWQQSHRGHQGRARGQHD